MGSSCAGAGTGPGGHRARIVSDVVPGAGNTGDARFFISGSGEHIVKSGSRVRIDGPDTWGSSRVSGPKARRFAGERWRSDACIRHRNAADRSSSDRRDVLACEWLRGPGRVRRCRPDECIEFCRATHSPLRCQNEHRNPPPMVPRRFSDDVSTSSPPPNSP